MKIKHQGVEKYMNIFLNNHIHITFPNKKNIKIMFIFKTY